MKDRSSFPIPGQRLAALLLLIGMASIVAAWLGHRPALGESQPQLVSMAISVMPEYDKPSVFVSYRGELNQDVALPLSVRIRVPADVSVDPRPALKWGSASRSMTASTTSDEPTPGATRYRV